MRSPRLRVSSIYWNSFVATLGLPHYHMKPIFVFVAHPQRFRNETNIRFQFLSPCCLPKDPSWLFCLKFLRIHKYFSNLLHKRRFPQDKIPRPAITPQDGGINSPRHCFRQISFAADTSEDIVFGWERQRDCDWLRFPFLIGFLEPLDPSLSRRIARAAPKAPAFNYGKSFWLDVWRQSAASPLKFIKNSEPNASFVARQFAQCLWLFI